MMHLTVTAELVWLSISNELSQFTVGMCSAETPLTKRRSLRAFVQLLNLLQGSIFMINFVSDKVSSFPFSN